MLSIAQYRVAQYQQFGFDFMNSRPWMPLYVNDFHMDTLELSAEEFGIYMILLMLMWTRDDGALPNDMDWLKRSLQAYVADFHGHSFNRIIPKLLKRYFQVGEDDKWMNKRLTKERQKLAKLSAKQSQNADKRWSKLRENNGLADANAMPSHSHSHSHSHIDLDLASSLHSEVKKGKRLSDSWQPSEDNLNFARDEGLSDSQINLEASKFRDYWISRAGAAGVKRDWDATWRNWIRKVKETKGNGHARRQTLTELADSLAQEARDAEFAASIIGPDEPFKKH